jgi:hypothetical protein
MLNLADALDREDELRQDFHAVFERYRDHINASSVHGNAHAPAYAPKGEQRQYLFDNSWIASDYFKAQYRLNGCFSYFWIRAAAEFNEPTFLWVASMM